MRKAETSDSELREQLKAEQARFQALSTEQESLKNDTQIVGNVAAFIERLTQLRAQLADSAEEITHLYKKLHPYFPVGTCPICHSVTTKIVGSGRNHWGCVACNYEGIE